jgi:hypothetical protein
MCSGEGDPTSLGPGFPIRTSSDHSSVDSSPRLIAASYVLHRLLVPRHPPCALTNLATKMLASTVQFSNNTRETPTHTATNTHHPHTTTRRRHAGDDKLMWPAAGARNQETHPTKRVFSQDPTVHRCPPPPPDHTGPEDDAGTCQRSTHERTPRKTNACERGHILHSSPPPVPCHHPPREVSTAGTGRDGHRQAL